MNKKSGFTLFELLVSISIMGIMVALAMVSYSSAQRKARDTRRKEDMKTVQTAAEQYYSLSGAYSYPSTTAPGDWTTTDGQVMLQKFPTDPKGTGWTGYTYGIATTYCACAAVESDSNGNSVDNACNFAGAVGNTGPYFCVKSQQ